MPLNLSDNADEIAAFIMVAAGVAILVSGSYALFFMSVSIVVEELLLISSALLLPSTGYLFGKSVPKKQSTLTSEK